jgi:hypothetical protein
LTVEDSTKKIDAFMSCLHMVRMKIVTEARAVVPVLLDAQRVNSAKPLQELLFELDVIEQEMKDFVMADPRAALEALSRKLGAP